MSPFGAPDWDHKPFAQGNQPVAQQCYELPGKFESTSLAPSGRAMAYGTAEGVWVAAIPEGCAPGDAGALVFPGAASPDWGPADVPAATRRRTAAPTTPAAPAAREAAPEPPRRPDRDAHDRRAPAARRSRRSSSAARSPSAPSRSNGRATVRFKLKRRGLVTVKATFKPAAGGAAQTVSAKLRLR